MIGRQSISAARGGYTLVECMAAVLILGLGLMASVGALTGALIGNQKASDMQLATAIAQGTIEEMRSLGFGSVTYEDFPVTSDESTEADLRALHGATRTITITDDYGGDARLKKVAVTVSWRGRTGRTASIALESIVTNRGGHSST